MLHSFLSFSTLPLPSFLSSCLHPLMSQHIPSPFLPSSSPYFKHSSSQLIFSTQCPPPLNLPSLSPFHLPSLSLSLPLPYLQLSLPPSSPPSPTSSSLPLPYLQLSSHCRALASRAFLSANKSNTSLWTIASSASVMRRRVRISSVDTPAVMCEGEDVGVKKGRV